MSDSLGRVLMFVENNFPGDPRVKNEADTLTPRVIPLRLWDSGKRIKRRRTQS